MREKSSLARILGQTIMPPKKCPVCNSSRVKSNSSNGKTTFKCYRCGFVNEKTN